jgi:hypothetical protein
MQETDAYDVQAARRNEITARMTHFDSMIVILRVYICLWRRAEKKKLLIVKAGAVHEFGRDL